MMKFRKNQNKEKQIPKEKKPRIYKVNPRKKVVIGLWVLWTYVNILDTKN